MKTVTHYCLWSTVILLCSGCLVHLDSKVNHRLQGSWRLSDVTPLQVSAKHNESFEEQADEKRLVHEGMVFNFFDDGTYTQLSREGRYVSGRWQYSGADGRLVLSDSGKNEGITSGTNGRK